MAIEIRKSAKAACQQEYYEEARLRVFAESLLEISLSYIKMEILINPRLLIFFRLKAAKRAHRIFVSMIMTIIILSLIEIAVFGFFLNQCLICLGIVITKKC